MQKVCKSIQERLRSAGGFTQWGDKMNGMEQQKDNRQEDREFYIDHDGIRLHAKLSFPEEKKEKYPLLIIEHGYTGHMEERHILAVDEAARSIGFAALRIELYGHGGSDGAFRDHTVLKWMSEMLTVIDYAKSLPFVDGLYLTGHSQGGLTAILAGAMKRDVLDGLIPLSPAISIKDKALSGDVFGVMIDPDHIPEEICLPEGRVLSGNYVRAAQMLPVDDAIRMYKKPVLIVHADTDEAVPVSCAYDAAEKYSNAKLVIIKNDTHCYDNRLPEVIEAVKQFLTGVEDRRCGNGDKPCGI